MSTRGCIARVGVHPIRYANGTALCRWCSRPTKHYTLFVCDERVWHRMCLASEREQFDRKFLNDCGILTEPPRVSSSRVRVEIVMQGESVRKARELHALRNRKPLMGERHATGCGELDLGEIS
jgi:hypothetical protein